MELAFLDRFSKNSEVSNFMKNLSSGSRVAPWQTDMTKLRIAFRNFTNATEKTKYFRWDYFPSDYYCTTTSIKGGNTPNHTRQDKKISLWFSRQLRSKGRSFDCACCSTGAVAT